MFALTEERRALKTLEVHKVSTSWILHNSRIEGTEGIWCFIGDNMTRYLLGPLCPWWEYGIDGLPPSGPEFGYVSFLSSPPI